MFTLIIDGCCDCSSIYRKKARVFIYDVVPQRSERLLEDLKPVEEAAVSET